MLFLMFVGLVIAIYGPFYIYAAYWTCKEDAERDNWIKQRTKDFEAHNKFNETRTPVIRIKK